MIATDMKVLVIEDDHRMVALIEQGLREEGYEVQVAYNGVKGLSLATESQFDVIILDVMLPGLDGLVLVRKLREAGNQTPVLMLTARDSRSDIVAGLDSGADDYLTKPFGFDVFLARVRAASRRHPIVRPVILSAGDLTLNTTSREVRVRGQYVSLTRTEYSILVLLLRQPNHIVSRDTILEEIWGENKDVKSNTLDAFMKLLRSKVDVDSNRRLIHTVRRVGYVLRTDS